MSPHLDVSGEGQRLDLHGEVPECTLQRSCILLGAEARDMQLLIRVPNLATRSFPRNQLPLRAMPQNFSTLHLNIWCSRQAGTVREKGSLTTCHSSPVESRGMRALSTILRFSLDTLPLFSPGCGALPDPPASCVQRSDRRIHGSIINA